MRIVSAQNGASLVVGAIASRQRLITEADVAIFALITGEIHPVYLDPAYASQTRFTRPIVPAALIGSIVTAACAEIFPEVSCLTHQQILSFQQPAFVEEDLSIQVQIEQIARDLVTCRVSAARPDGALVIQGTVSVMLEDLPAAPSDWED